MKAFRQKSRAVSANAAEVALTLLSLIASATFLSIGAANRGAQISTPVLPAPGRSAANLAMLLATSGYSAGFIVMLPAALDGLPPSQHSAFDIWFRSDATQTDNVRRLTSPEQLERALRGFTSRSSDGWIAATSPDTRHTTLNAQAAASCQQRLQGTLGRPVEGTDLLAVLARIVRSATAAPVPGGFVGSCIGTNQFSKQPIAIAGGTTIERALNSAAIHFGSAVWVAVESRSGACSLGVIHRAESGGVCTVGIVGDLGAGR